MAVFDRLVQSAVDPETEIESIVDRVAGRRTHDAIVDAALTVAERYTFTDPPRKNDYPGWMAFLAEEARRQPKPCAYLTELLDEALESRQSAFLTAVIDSIITLDLRILTCTYEPRPPLRSKSASPGRAKTLSCPLTPSGRSASASTSGTPMGSIGSPTSAPSSKRSTAFQPATALEPAETTIRRNYAFQLARWQKMIDRMGKRRAAVELEGLLLFVLEERESPHFDVVLAGALDAFAS